jgi:hypothetical protein
MEAKGASASEIEAVVAKTVGGPEICVQTGRPFESGTGISDGRQPQRSRTFTRAWQHARGRRGPPQAFAAATAVAPRPGYVGRLRYSKRLWRGVIARGTVDRIMTVIQFPKPIKLRAVAPVTSGPCALLELMANEIAAKPNECERAEKFAPSRELGLRKWDGAKVKGQMPELAWHREYRVRLRFGRLRGETPALIEQDMCMLRCVPFKFENRTLAMRKFLTFLKRQNPRRARQGFAGGWQEASSWTRCRAKDPQNSSAASKFLQARSLSRIVVLCAMLLDDRLFSQLIRRIYVVDGSWRASVSSPTASGSWTQIAALANSQNLVQSQIISTTQTGLTVGTPYNINSGIIAQLQNEKECARCLKGQAAAPWRKHQSPVARNLWS